MYVKQSIIIIFNLHMKLVCHSVTVSFCYSRPMSHKLEFAAEGGKKFLVDVEAPAIAFPRPF